MGEMERGRELNKKTYESVSWDNLYLFVFFSNVWRVVFRARCHCNLWGWITQVDSLCLYIHPIHIYSYIWYEMKRETA